MVPSLLHEVDVDEDITIITLAPLPHSRVAALNAAAGKAAKTPAKAVDDGASAPKLGQDPRLGRSSALRPAASLEAESRRRRGSSPRR